jgi:hypothetical protein
MRRSFMKQIFAAAMLTCLLLSGEAVGQVPMPPAAAEQIELAKQAFAAGKYRDAIGAFKKANKLQGDACFHCWVGVAAASLKMGITKLPRKPPTRPSLSPRMTPTARQSTISRGISFRNRRTLRKTTPLQKKSTGQLRS